MRNGWIKMLCALALGLSLVSCGLVGRALNHQTVDPNTAQVKVKKNAKGELIPSLELPGADAPGAAGMMPQTGFAGAGGEGGAPSGGMYDFSSAFQNQAVNRLAHWRFSGTEAITEARRTGTPLLIFFTQAGTKPAMIMDNALSTSPDLTGEAGRFIPLRVDYSDKRVSDSDYYKGLQNRYKPRGYPVLVLALPDGTELTRQTGCTEDWGKNVNHWLDDAAFRAKNGVEVHRKKLAGQHYRLWKNGDGHEIFARLDSQDANKLVFTTEWGESIQTFANRLSAADQKMIEEKRAY